MLVFFSWIITVVSSKHRNFINPVQSDCVTFSFFFFKSYSSRQLDGFRWGGGLHDNTADF